MIGKRGQKEGKAVGTLILIIGLFMVLYLLFVPPETREELLQGQNDATVLSSTSQYEEVLSESPGLLLPAKEYGSSYSMPSINLFIKTEPELEKLAKNLEVTYGLFSRSSPTLSFELENLDDLNKLSLYFKVDEAKGSLKIKVNGKDVYSEKISTPGIKVIDVPVSYLTTNNKIEIKVSSPGFAFWSKNQYILSDVGVRKEYELINAREKRMFTLSSSDYGNLDEASLNYYLYCNELLEDETSNLKIMLNQKEVFDGEIRCISNQESVDIDPNYLREGTNELLFFLEKGDFSLNQVVVKTKAKSLTYPTYYFSLKSSDLDKVFSGKKSVILKAFLEESGKEKSARIHVNSELYLMRTSGNVYEQEISAVVEEGTNFIRIVPTKSFEMVGLKVVLE